MSLLDIIIPQYNENDEMVSQLLDSINMQKGIDFNDINIVIINDCSNVLLSTELFYNYPKLKVKYLKMEKNSGPGVTRQFGVDNTKSPYVTFIDADDVLYDQYSLYIAISCIKEISPDVFIDHHNSSAKNLMYATSRDRNLIDISASHISDISRRWKVERSNIFPMDGKIYGHTEIAPETGLRSTYASEQGIWAWTYETSCRLFYKDGIESDVYQEEYSENVETLATEAFCNFLLRVLKLYKK